MGRRPKYTFIYGLPPGGETRVPDDVDVKALRATLHTLHQDPKYRSWRLSLWRNDDGHLMVSRSD